MIIHYSSAPCGAGKSYNAAKRIISCTGRYLVVRDRVDAIQEFALQLSTMASEAGLSLCIDIITNRSSRGVRFEVESLPGKYSCLPHVAVLITHKALMMSDFSKFKGWHVIIDETPAVLDRQDLQTAASREFFERNYALEPLQGSWSSVTLNREGWDATPAKLEADDCFRLLRVYHERVTAATPKPAKSTARTRRRVHRHDESRRAVIANLVDWADMEDGRRWTWWSLWSPHQLAAFASIQFMANDFDRSLTFKMLRQLNPTIQWIEMPLPSPRNFKQRSVHIEFFANQHTASQTLFDSNEGKANLQAIAHHLAKRKQIWMANERHANDLLGMGGVQLSPLQAGSNLYAGYSAATAIYCVKPSAETRAIMELVGVPPESWTHSYEFETILQFMTRISIRDPQSTEPVTLTVYDRDQAEHLAEYFRRQPHCDVSLCHVDLGLVDRVRRPGRKAAVLSVEEADAKKLADMAKRAAAARLRRAKRKLSDLQASRSTSRADV